MIIRNNKQAAAMTALVTVPRYGRPVFFRFLKIERDMVSFSQFKGLTLGLILYAPCTNRVALGEDACPNG